MEPPSEASVQEAIYLLKVKNALDVKENLTPLGGIVARLEKNNLPYQLYINDPFLNTFLGIC